MNRGTLGPAEAAGLVGIEESELLEMACNGFVRGSTLNRTGWHFTVVGLTGLRDHLSLVRQKLGHGGAAA